MNDLIYAYCLSNTPPDLTRTDRYGGLRNVSAGGFYIIVKTVQEDEFSEEILKINLSDIQWLEAHVREHVEVINLIMEQVTVIPFKFGTIYHTEERLRNFVGDYAESLAENLLHLEQKEEWSVKIYCDRKTLCDQMDELSEEAAALERQIMASSPGKAFLLKRKKSDLMINEMDRLCKIYGQEYFDGFKALSEATSLNNLLPKEYTGRNDEMILNAAFLVGKERTAGFILTAKTMKNKYADIGFDVELTGPWPPFSFTSLTEKQQ